MTKKRKSGLSTDDLIKIVQREDGKEKSSYVVKVDENKVTWISMWMSHYEIRAGIVSVNSTFLYNHFRDYVIREGGTNIATHREFGLFLKQHVKKVTIGGARHYKINKDLLDDKEKEEKNKEEKS